jgi:predicted Rossmann-fold nucleotide-binding protein
MVSRFDDEAARLSPAFPPGRRLVVVGSTSFWGRDSAELCRGVAVRLASIPDLIAITGGMTGVGETFGRSFASERRRLGLPEQLYHLLPRGLGVCDTSVTLYAGIDYEQRREVLGRLGEAYLVVEGGPGTEHEVGVARERGAIVIPVGRTGGHAGDVYPSLEKPPGAELAD